MRLIVHERRQRLTDSVLQPADAFLVGEFPSVNVLGKTTIYELDYERRFSPRAFARLFLFRSDVNDLSVSPAVGQTVIPIGFVVPEAQSEGIGLRYEQQIGLFLSSYLRYTYSEVTDRTTRSTRGRQLPMNPRSRAVLGLNYVDRAGTKFLVETNWSGEMYVDPIWSDTQGFDPRAPRPQFPDKLVVDLQLAKERTVRREWLFRINNVFNTTTIYWPGFPRPGRTYQLQYFIRF
jgi:outer membrane receptor protein involved in Fe transport